MLFSSFCLMVTSFAVVYKRNHRNICVAFNFQFVVGLLSIVLFNSPVDRAPT